MKDNKIRIMYAIIGSGFGGLERVVMNIIDGLDQDFYERYLLCISPPTLLGDEFKDSDAKLITLNYGRGKHFSLPFKIHEIVKENGIDILHVHDFNPYFYCTLGTLANRSLKRVYTEHGGIYFCRERHLRYMRIFSAFTDAMVMVSKDLENYYKNRIGINSRRLLVIYNGIDFKEPCNMLDSQGVRKSIGIGREDLVIGTTGRLIEGKGLRYLINVAPMIVKEFPSAKFVIVGDGRLKETLQVMVREMNLTNYFRFLGYRKDIYELLSVFDVYALPSLSEGFPLTVLEAMFCKKAVVASRVGGVPEILGGNERGILVEPGENEELGQSLIKLLANKKLRDEMGTRGFEHVKANFTRDRMLKEYDTLYKALIK